MRFFFHLPFLFYIIYFIIFVSVRSKFSQLYFFEKCIFTTFVLLSSKEIILFNKFFESLISPLIKDNRVSFIYGIIFFLVYFQLFPQFSF